jgi:hypothetical protein
LLGGGDSSIEIDGLRTGKERRRRKRNEAGVLVDERGERKEIGIQCWSDQNE